MRACRSIRTCHGEPAPSYMIRGPILKINRRSSGMQEAVTCDVITSGLYERKVSCTAPARCRPAPHKIILRYGARPYCAPHEDEEIPGCPARTRARGPNADQPSRRPHAE
jgi:hypothetical protein